MLITLSSAKGAPGVTTTTLGMALTWPSPVLVVEADTSGSSILPGAFRGQVPYTKGLVPLVGNQITVEGIWSQTINLTPNVHVLPGIQRPTQARALTSSWGQLTTILQALEQVSIDVLVDMGRSLGMDDTRSDLVQGADLNLVLTSSRLPDIATTRELARRMPHEKGPLEALTSSRLVVVGPGRPYTSKNISSQIGLPLLESVSHDPVNADHLSVGAPAGRRFTSSSLMRSLATTSKAARAAVARRYTSLGKEKP